MKKWLPLVALLIIVSISSLSAQTSTVDKTVPNNVFDPRQELKKQIQELEKSIAESNELAKILDYTITAEEIRKSESELVATSLIRTFTSRGGKRDSSFITLDLNTPSNLSAEQFDVMLEGTPLYEYGWIFEKAELEIGVNGLFLMALTGQEQSFGAASTGLQDKYNLTSWNAADGKEHLATTFESYWDCIETTAKSLKKNYLTSGGKYYNGTSLTGVNVRYASDPGWARSIANIMETRLKKLNN